MQEKRLVTENGLAIVFRRKTSCCASTSWLDDDPRINVAANFCSLTRCLLQGAFKVQKDIQTGMAPIFQAWQHRHLTFELTSFQRKFTWRTHVVFDVLADPSLVEVMLVHSGRVQKNLH